MLIQFPKTRINATNAAKIKTVSNTDSLLPVPERWEAFASLCNIRSGTAIVKFQPYDYQIAISDIVDNHYATIIGKTRQLGLTETIANKFLHKAAKQAGYAAVVLSKSQADSSNIAKRIRLMTDSLTDYIRLVSDSLTTIELHNGSKIFFRPATANGTRGLESISDILFDEAAFVENIERIYTSAVPATSMVGDAAKLIFISTPNGKTGFYWDLINKSNGIKNIESICTQIREEVVNPFQCWTDKNGWAKVLIHWKAHPIYGSKLDYLETVKQQQQLPESAIEQEYNLSFVEGDTTVFTSEIIEANAVSENITLQRRQRSSFQKHSYAAGLDPAYGGSDYLVLTILDTTTLPYKVVYTYRDRKRTSAYHIEQIVDALQRFQPDALCVESNGGGVLYSQQIAKRWKGKIEDFYTSASSKPGLIDGIVLLLERNHLLFQRDSALYQELYTFRRIENKLEAASGSHDDTVLSLGLAVAVAPERTQRIAPPQKAWILNVTGGYLQVAYELIPIGERFKFYPQQPYFYKKTEDYFKRV